MLEMLGPVLIVIGILGVIYQCVIFIKETLPANYGNNPGFGCFEVMTCPWFAAGSFGLGLFMQSWRWGFMVFGFGMFFMGFLAMLLARLFRGQGGKRS